NFQSHGKDGISFRESRNKSRSTDGVSFRQPVSKALSKDSISFRQTVLNRPAKDTISFRLSDNQAKTPKSLKESIRDKLSTGWSELHKPRTLTMDSFYLDNMKKNNKHFNSLLVKLNEEVSIWQLLKNGGRLIIGTYMFVLDKVNSLGTLKKEQDKKQTIGMLLKEKKPSFGESLFSKYFGMSSKNDSASQMQDGLYSLFKSSDSSHSEKSAGSGGGSGATTGAGGGGNDGSPSIQNKTSEGDIPQDISVLQFKEMQKEVLELSKYFRSIVYKFQVLTMILNHVTGDTKNFLEHFCTIINESITPSEPNENESTVKNKNKNTDFSKAFQNNFVGLLEAKDQLNNLSYNVMDYYSDTKTKVLDGLSDEKKESLIEQLDMSKEKVSPETFNHVHKELTDIFSMHSKMKDYFSEKDDVVNKIQFNLTAKVA
ncbi:hypothetical protein HOG98_04955, partial [bacterium]|nr:hypothetical protein [bacterium]